MTKEEFRADLAQYQTSELALIAATQADVYSPAEMAVIREELDARRQAESARRKAKDTNDTLPCIVSLIFPIIGIVLALILLHNSDPANQVTGKRYLCAALVALVLFAFLVSGGIIL